MALESFRKYSREPIAFLKTRWGDLGIFNWKTTLGRHDSNNLVLSDGWVSGKHGEIIFDVNNHRFLFRDHSSNGTYINGHHIKNQTVVLPSPARIQIMISSTQKTVMDFEAAFGALVDEHGKVHVIPLNKEITLGRHGTIPLTEADQSISRNHATIRFHPEKSHYELEDHSMNGTDINKKHINKKTVILRDKDVISLSRNGGNTYKFIHFVPISVHSIKKKIVEPKKFELAEWEKLLGMHIPFNGMWASYGGHVGDSHYSGWKFHIYADNDEDLFNMGRVLLPLIQNNRLHAKTISEPKHLNLLKGGPQQGKAFVIYLDAPTPTDINMVRGVARQIARKIVLLLSTPQLRAKKTYHIIGDKRVPGDASGRLFYRYDGKVPGPGPDVGYRSNGIGANYNVPNNPDLF
jgi:pSer/pThr/pTyr-binding forkhead associated (FHA) protein